jgi:hypothetical protein
MYFGLPSSVGFSGAGGRHDAPDITGVQSFASLRSVDKKGAVFGILGLRFWVWLVLVGIVVCLLGNGILLLMYMSLQKIVRSHFVETNSAAYTGRRRCHISIVEKGKAEEFFRREMR